MTWCLQCGGVLIGVDPIPAKDLKRKKAKDAISLNSRGNSADSFSSRGRKHTRSKSTPVRARSDSAESRDLNASDTELIQPVLHLSDEKLNIVNHNKKTEPNLQKHVKYTDQQADQNRKSKIFTCQ